MTTLTIYVLYTYQSFIQLAYRSLLTIIPLSRKTSILGWGRRSDNIWTNTSFCFFLCSTLPLPFYQTYTFPERCHIKLCYHNYPSSTTFQISTTYSHRYAINKYFIHSQPNVSTNSQTGVILRPSVVPVSFSISWSLLDFLDGDLSLVLYVSL